MSELLQKIKTLKKHFDDGDIPTLEEHEVHPNLPVGDKINYIYFTLPCCINYQRSSFAMWQSALKTYDDDKTRYLFHPEKVVKEKREKIQKDLTKHKLALQYNKHTDIWINISTTFAVHYQSDPRIFLSSCNNDVTCIIDKLQIKNRERFPHLRGPKLSNYWLMILDFYTDIQFRNKHYISIIPDTHVIKASRKLGIIEKHEKSQEVITNKWFYILKDTKITPLDMHPVLWNWSRNNFIPDI